METPLSVLRKAVEVYQFSYESILGLEGQSDDIAKLYQDIKFILLCQEIYKRPELMKIFSRVHGLSDKYVGRLSRFIDCLVSE